MGKESVGTTLQILGYFKQEPTFILFDKMFR